MWKKTIRSAEGVTLSGVLRNTKLHADKTLESPGKIPGAEGAQAGITRL